MIELTMRKVSPKRERSGRSMGKVWTISTLAAASLGSVIVASAAGCGGGVDAVTPAKLEQQYGISGAHTEIVTTSEGSVRGTLVPVTLADGRKLQLFMPEHQRNDAHAVYARDDDGLHPVRIKEHATREEITQAPAVVERQPEPTHKQKRSWEKDALIIGGSAGAGAGIGAVAGGSKGAAVGATAGGIGGLIYDLATRNK
jgi:hypothetical protein